MLKKRERVQSDGAPEKLTWYQKFGLFFFTRARVTLLLWVLLASFGAASYSALIAREGFPDVSAPYSTVSGTYFVDDAERIDKEVAKPLSEAILGVDGVTQVSSQAGDNFFAMQVEFEEKISSAEGNSRIERAVESQSILPKGAEAEFKPLFVSKLTPEGDDQLISVSSNELSIQQLQSRAEAVAANLNEGGSASIEGAERVRVIDQFRRGIDAGGQEVVQRQSFDWIALPDKNDELEFKQSVLVAVKAEQGVDALALDEATQKSLSQLRADFEFSSVQLEIAADFAGEINKQINSLQNNMLGGLIAVIVVSFLLVSFRASLISALSMVTTLAVAVGLLYLFGQTLNVITMFALILSLGLIVDDSTIMTEAIDRARRKSVKAKTAIATALKKIALASVAGTLTTMLGFAPLLFIGGIIGEFIWAIPITIIISLGVSLVLSMTLIPFLSRFILLRGKAKPLRNPVARAEAAAGRALAQLVRRAGAKRKQGAVIGLAAVGLSILLFIGGMWYAGKLQFNIFPNAKDGDAIMVQVRFASDRLENASQTSRQINSAITQELGEFVERVSYQGSGSTGGSVSLFDLGTYAVIDLVPYQEREPTAHQLADRLQEQLDDVEGATARAAAQTAGPPEGGFSVRIQSEDQAKSANLAESIDEFLFGHQLERSNGTTAQITESSVSGSGVVQREDGHRYVQVNASFDDEDISALVVLTQEAVEREFTPQRLEREFGLSQDVLNFSVGQEAENQESFAGMVIAFPILLLLMYVLLAVQFRSLSQPLLIFMAIPFSLFGAMTGLYFTDNPFSFFTMLAVFALLGISVNNTILLVAYANQARIAGASRIEAIASALEERFRPLLATSLTTVVALVPLALSDPFWESLTVALIFGLLSSTFLVIVSFPYYYLANEFMRVRFSRKKILLWLAGLVAASVALGFAASSLIGVFMAAYLIGTFVWLAGRALTRAVRAKRA